MFWRNALYSEQAGRQKNSELISIFRILPLLVTLLHTVWNNNCMWNEQQSKRVGLFQVKAKIVQYQGKAQKEKAFLQTEFEKSIFSKLCCELQVCKYFPFSAQTAYFSTLEEFSFTLFYFLSLFSTFTFLLSVYLSLSSLSYFLYSFPATLNLPWHNFLVFSYPLLCHNH